MHKGLVVEVSAAGRARLELVVAARTSPQQHVRRARIVLSTEVGHGTALIMRRAAVSKVAVGRRQEQLMGAGVGGRPGWAFHLKPTSASWPHAVSGCVDKFSHRRPKAACSPRSSTLGRVSTP
ncbi:MAG: hypothetical protein WAS21_19920 [Geminicoccaceae bacterium]